MGQFNINDIIADMASAIKGSVSKDWNVVQPIVSQFLERRKERLVLIAELMSSGEMNAQEFNSRLDNEKLLLETELQAIAVVHKAIAQNAANAAIDVLEKAVQVAIRSI
jgi:hypothetical protein